MAKTNLIWIIADQLRADMVSCNGDGDVSTPNIDVLAESGVNFCRALSTYPLCCPARGSMLTSVYPNRCTLGHEYRMPAGQKTIADALNERGYHTAWIGKWHLDGWREKYSRAAFHIVPPARRGGFHYWLGYENNNSQYDCYVHGGDGLDEIPPTKLEGYETDCLTDLFLDHLGKRPKGKPFFAVLSVQPPHDPYVAPERNSHYDPASLHLRANMPPEIPPYLPYVGKMRQNLANAYAMIENFDENVGRVVSYLKQEGLYDDTVIMVFSDHGDSHGSHGQERKTNPYEESIRVPFIIGGKDLAIENGYHGVHPGNLISSVDIAPTSLGILGYDHPKEWGGCDYSPACRRSVTTDFSFPDSAYIQSVIPEHHPHSIELPWRGVVTSDGWKYVCLEGKPWMLFDLNTDPYELRNLAFNGEAKDQRARLSLMLQEWIRRTGDHFVLPRIEITNDLSEDARDQFGYNSYAD